MAKVFAKKGIKGVHKCILAKRDLLSALLAINIANETIPNYYIFKEVRQIRNYIAKCEDGAMMNTWRSLDVILQNHLCQMDI